MEDLTNYLKELYNQKLKSAVDNLTSAYKNSISDLDNQGGQIAKQYKESENQTAAQNDLQKQAWNESANVSGLNTGARGQAALAMGNTLQTNLRKLSESMNTSLANLNTQRQKLKNTYDSNVSAATESNAGALNQALYSEMQRQQTERAKEAAAQRAVAKSQLDDLIKSGTTDFSPYQNLISQSGYSADYVNKLGNYYAGLIAAQNAADTQAATTATSQAATAATSQAATAATSQAATTATSQAATTATSQAATTATSQAATTATSQAASSRASVTATTSGTSGIDNGGISENQVRDVQTWLNQNGANLAVDGQWGDQSRSAAGGMTADEAYAAMHNSGATRGAAQVSATGISDADFKALRDTIRYGKAYKGSAWAASKLLEYAPRLSDDQYSDLSAYI